MKYINNFSGWVNESVSSNEADKIVYGNQPKDLQKFADDKNDPIKNWFIEKGLVDTIVKETPLNSGSQTRKDLDTIVEKMSKATPEDLAFARYIDDEANIPKAFIDLLGKYGHKVFEEEHLFVEAQSDAILFYLKDVINRPRPYQLAYYYKIDLYPLIRTTAMTASYPSGHALAGIMMSEHYAKLYPDASVELKELGNKIANSRELTGIHYPSDTEISRKISKIIIDNNLLQIKK